MCDSRVGMAANNVASQRKAAVAAGYAEQASREGYLA